MLSMKIRCLWCSQVAFVCLNTLAELDAIECPMCKRNGWNIVHITGGSLDRGSGGKGSPGLLGGRGLRHRIVQISREGPIGHRSKRVDKN